MQQKPSVSGRQADVKDAMDRVLNAERASREAIGDAQRRAAEIIAAANEEIRRIENRAAGRIRRAHHICTESVPRGDARAADGGGTPEGGLTQEERRAIAEAAQWLAAQLCGEDHGHRREL